MQLIFNQMVICGDRLIAVGYLSENRLKIRSTLFRLQVVNKTIRSMDFRLQVVNKILACFWAGEKGSEQSRLFSPIPTVQENVTIENVSKERLVNQGYNKKSIDQQFSVVKTIDRNELLKEKNTC